MLLAAHAGPSLVIAAITVALGIKAGAGVGVATILTVAALSGQFSVGWSNDALDAGRDRATERTEKPIVSGIVSRRAVAAAAGIALTVSTVAGFVINASTGLASVVMVLAGWAYNLGLKASIASGLMYVIGFGVIPVVAAAAAGTTSSTLLVMAAAAVGLGGHFTNVLADLDADLKTGVRGLPQRIAEAFGLGPVRWLAFVLLAGASVAVVGANGLSAIALVGLGAVALLSVIGLIGRGRAPFVAALVIAVVDVALLLMLG